MLYTSKSITSVFNQLWDHTFPHIKKKKKENKGRVKSKYTILKNKGTLLFYVKQIKNATIEQAVHYENGMKLKECTVNMFHIVPSHSTLILCVK